MRHCILVKFAPGAGDWRQLLPEIRALFEAAAEIPGVHGAQLWPRCVERENRWHLLIRLDMEPEALAAYDASAMHRQWKERFGPLLEQKAIFDYEEELPV